MTAEGPVLEAAEDRAPDQEALQGALATFASIMDGALPSSDLDELLDAMLERIRRSLDIDIAVVFFLNESRKWLSVEASQGFRHPHLLPGRVSAGQWFARHVMERRQPLAMPRHEFGQKAQELAATERLQWLLGVPLVVDEDPAGVIMVGRRSKKEFTRGDVLALEMVADRLAVGIDHARLLAKESREKDRLARQNDFKGDLLNMAAHDLKTPLSTLRMELQMLKRHHGKPGVFERSHGLMEKNLRRLERLLDDFLDLARAETGKFQLEHEVVDVAHAVEAGVRHFMPEATRRGMDLVQQTEAGVLVLGDERRLVQVVTNLISNAFKYTPDGGSIEVAVAATPDAVDITVADTGIGMAAEESERLFSAFGQIDARAKGSGLGLYLSKIIVEEHGGQLTIESPGKGRGTKAKVCLPRK